jgi:hypothetical protein
VGLFNRNKLDKNTQIILEKIGRDSISGRAIVRVHGAMPLMDFLPEGIGRFFLKSDGTCFVMMDWDFQDLPLFDEIHFSEIKSWGLKVNYPIFTTINLEHDIIDESEDKIFCIEDIFYSIMFVQVNDYSIENSFHIRNWLERYHSGLEKFSA